MSDRNVWIVTRGLIFLNALAFVEFGTRFLLWTQHYAERDGIQLQDAAGLAEVRAFFGGLVLSIGVFFVWSLFRQTWTRSALVVVALTSLFLLGARLYSFALAGAFVESMYAAVIMEAVSGALAVVLLRTKVLAHT